MDDALKIASEDNPTNLRALFGFDSSTPPERIALKFNFFARYFFVKFFPSEDAPFHREMDLFNARIYAGKSEEFLNICFRGAAKTTRTKLFVAFAIANDRDHFRKYVKILSRDSKNSTQFVTDIYNLLINPRVKALYPGIFAKTDTKREETMSSFTTAFGVKITAGTVGSSQRGNIQDESRPDLIIMDDFEDRISLRSAVLTQAIFDNSEEARTGLSRKGGIIYLCNYLSERGNVHKLVGKVKNRLIVPIIVNGVPSWSIYSKSDVEKIRQSADDFAGEYLCEPSAGADVFFDRPSVKKQEEKTPIRDIAGFRIYHNYVHDHRYGMGVDTAGGVGLDSSATVIIDFSTIPARVAATFSDNYIKPSTFGDEIRSQADRYGAPIVAVENNKYDMVIGRLRQIYDNLYFTEQKETRVGMPPTVRSYGWNTNQMTKPKALFDFKKAVEDGLLELSDAALKAECMSYSRDDLMDGAIDSRLTTRHFDLLIAASIAWQMKSFAEAKKEDDGNGAGYKQADYQRSGLE